MRTAVAPANLPAMPSSGVLVGRVGRCKERGYECKFRRRRQRARFVSRYRAQARALRTKLGSLAAAAPVVAPLLGAIEAKASPDRAVGPPATAARPMPPFRRFVIALERSLQDGRPDQVAANSLWDALKEKAAGVPVEDATARQAVHPVVRA